MHTYTHTYTHFYTYTLTYTPTHPHPPTRSLHLPTTLCSLRHLSDGQSALWRNCFPVTCKLYTISTGASCSSCGASMGMIGQRYHACRLLRRSTGKSMLRSVCVWGGGGIGWGGDVCVQGLMFVGGGGMYVFCIAHTCVCIVELHAHLCSMFISYTHTYPLFM